MSPFMSSSAFYAVPLTLIINIILLIKLRSLKQRLVAISILLILATTSIIAGRETWNDYEEHSDYEEYSD